MGRRAYPTAPRRANRSLVLFADTGALPASSFALLLVTDGAYARRPMAGGEDKGFLISGMKFGVGGDGEPEQKGPLLALRVLVIADLVPQGEYNAGASAPETPIRVDGARFDEL